MGLYIDGVPMDIFLAAGEADAVFLGDDQVWPGLTYPYVQENVNVTDAQVPTDATGCWITLVGGGAGGARGGSSSGPNPSLSYSAQGGGGGASIFRFFLERSALGSTYTLTRGAGGAGSTTAKVDGNNGTPSRFESGTVVLTAGGGLGDGTGGSPSVSGLPSGSPTTVNGAAGSGTRTLSGSSSTGSGAGGGAGGDAAKSGSQATGRSGSSGGTATAASGSGPVGNGGKGGKGSGRTAGSQYYLYGGGGGGGGGGYAGTDGSSAGTSSTGVGGGGGSGYVKVEWVAEYSNRDITYTMQNPGSWTFQLPLWAAAGALVDVVAIGGGAGGSNGIFPITTGNGGKSSAFVSASLVVGTDIAPGGVLSGVVGAGGGSGNGSGQTTTCTTAGITSTGGSGTVGGLTGQSPTPLELNGVTYTVGGHGGYAGLNAVNDMSSGSPGGGGCVFIRVRQV